MQAFFEKVFYFQEKVIDYFFTRKIEYKKKKFYQKKEREMEIEEIESYKFKLFTSYSLIIVVIVILLLSSLF